ncbi:MAG: hypothetical protein KDD50_02825 [Bdellovibrionales bacterium]|nr:hypothetical protein [Bdellovibrionales bacterium]
MKLKYSQLLILILVLSGCQTKPTLVYESRQFAEIRLMVEGTKKPLVIGENTKVIDVRSPFHYSLYHVPHSINLSWQEFANTKNHRFRSDREDVARRLARLGIAPNKRVVILDQGQQGHGEAGRLALTLYDLGIRDVQIAALSYFPKKNMVQKKPEKIKNSEYWKASEDSKVMVDRDQLIRALKGNTQKKAFVIDVRSASDYLNKSNINPKFGILTFNAINIPWKEFLTYQGRPELKFKKHLQGLQIHPEDEIIVLGEKGLSSAAVTFCLLSLGYHRARFYPEGWSGLR